MDFLKWLAIWSSIFLDGNFIKNNYLLNKSVRQCKAVSPKIFRHLKVMNKMINKLRRRLSKRFAKLMTQLHLINSQRMMTSKTPLRCHPRICPDFRLVTRIPPWNIVLANSCSSRPSTTKPCHSKCCWPRIRGDSSDFQICWKKVSSH